MHMHGGTGAQRCTLQARLSDGDARLCSRIIDWPKEKAGAGTRIRSDQYRSLARSLRHAEQSAVGERACMASPWTHASMLAASSSAVVFNSSRLTSQAAAAAPHNS